MRASRYNRPPWARERCLGLTWIFWFVLVLLVLLTATSPSESQPYYGGAVIAWLIICFVVVLLKMSHERAPFFHETEHEQRVRERDEQVEQETKAADPPGIWGGEREWSHARCTVINFLNIVYWVSAVGWAAQQALERESFFYFWLWLFLAFMMEGAFFGGLIIWDDFWEWENERRKGKK